MSAETQPAEARLKMQTARREAWTSMADGGQTKRSQSPLRCRMETRNAPAAEKMQRNREADDEKRSAREVDVPEVGAREADRREADAPEAVTHRADARAAGSHAAGARAAGAREVESVERSRTDAPEAGGEAALALQRGSRGTGPEVDVGKRNGQEAGRDMPQSPRKQPKPTNPLPPKQRQTMRTWIPIRASHSQRLRSRRWRWRA